MPVEHAIWKIGPQPERLEQTTLKNEQDLEEMICSDTSLLNANWMLIGRQVPTAYGKVVDLIAMDISENLILIELKKNKTPREVVAQAIDYACWIRDLESEDIADIFDTFVDGKTSLNKAFHDDFGQALDEDELNQSHQIVIVAAELDSSTERIVNYLSPFNNSNLGPD